MIKSLAYLLSLTLLAQQVLATSLTYWVNQGAHECFYTWVPEPGRKVAFYFAVQTGGDFDIDFTVTDPNTRVLFNGQKKRQGDYIFTGKSQGEYSFCFDNTQVSSGQKLVDFDITVENEEHRASMPVSHPLGAEQASAMDESIFRMSTGISNVLRAQKYFRTRENRNFSTVKSTENRVFWFSFFESATIVTMAAVQVYVVKAFFNNRRGGGRI
ncbi:emp24/gp25L/p24 family/GOLD-domain-containing protein [Syncephalis plumigaleata]|nr:emp24/gp25L/p24 family/GOLD-domain-containing protein [Syncephalis plumigaleata]